MNVVIQEDGHFFLSAGKEEEHRMMLNFFVGIPDGAALQYKGRGNDPKRPGGQFSVATLGYGEKEVILSGTTDADAQRISGICSGCDTITGPTFVWITETDEDGVVVKLFLAEDPKGQSSQGMTAEERYSALLQEGIVGGYVHLRMIE